MDHQSHIFHLIAATLLLTMLAACHPATIAYQDRYYDPAAAIPLTAGGVQAGQWETFEMTVHYSYQAADKLQVSGTATLGRHYQDLYERVTKLDFYLFLLDDDAKVLQSKLLGREWMVDTDVIMSFAETMPLPPDASRIGFGYEGRVLSSDPKPESTMDWFYKLPLSRTP